jgi:hypothetical protein
MWVVCCGVYTVGESVRRKIQIQNAADAAAYSAAVVQADTISRIATINRAMAWTYLQMTRRQMDYIVAKWIGLAQQRIDEDRKAMKDYHGKSVCIGCQKGHDSSSPGEKTYWCGFSLPPLIRDRVFAINNDDPWFANVSQDLVRAYQWVYRGALPLKNHKSGNANLLHGLADLAVPQRQIICDRINILAMNGHLMTLCTEYSGKVNETVEQVVKANLPSDLLGEFNFTCKFSNPFTGLWFDVLHNNKEDERRFLAFSGDAYNKKVHDTFNKGVQEDNDSGGINHWFVRCDMSQKPEQSSAEGAGSIGIQRCYRFNEAEAQKKQGNGSPPMNNDIDHDSHPDPSAALVAEYNHNAAMWFCLEVHAGPINIDIHIGIPYAYAGGDCKFSKGDVGYVDAKRHNCVQALWGTAMGWAGLMLPPCLPGPAGGGRVYGDDPEIKDTLTYTGERCLPFVFNSMPSGFFGRGGTILVGVARKSENVWDKLFGRAAQGGFKAFDPARSVTHLWAVSAARAGYREWGNTEAGNYQLGYTTDDGDDYRNCWNLRQTDWDALFVPVKHAYDFCMGTRGGAAMFTSIPGNNPLQMAMDATWTPLASGNHSQWGNPTAPQGMAGGGTLNWTALNAVMRH